MNFDRTSWAGRPGSTVSGSCAKPGPAGYAVTPGAGFLSQVNSYLRDFTIFSSNFHPSSYIPDL